MRIALDGCDGTGKSTICEKLTREFECNLIRLMIHGERTTRGYIDLMCADNVVHDRTFISEMVYPKYFARKTQLNDDDIALLFRTSDALKINTFILTASTETIRKRISERGDEYIHDVSLFEKINDDYLRIAKENNITVIDTTDKTIDEIVKEIGGKLQYDI